MHRPSTPGDWWTEFDFVSIQNQIKKAKKTKARTGLWQELEWRRILLRRGAGEVTKLNSKTKVRLDLAENLDGKSTDNGTKPDLPLKNQEI